MKEERVFSKNGFYSYVLQSNLMLHRHVARAGTRLVSAWLQSRGEQHPVRLLDLACGGEPVAICGMISAFPQVRFDYTGIDINADQVEMARHEFQYPSNVMHVQIFEANAWDLSALPADRQFDIVYTGMNVHHGTPEEIFCLLQQVSERLTPGGLFLNHDCYRPEDFGYLRRPLVNPIDPSDSFAMVSDEVLASFPAMSIDFPESDPETEIDWRLTFVDEYASALRELGADEEGIREVVLHVLTRDFPLSVTEMQAVAQAAGFVLHQSDLDARDQPLDGYFQLVSAIKHHG